MTNSADLRNNTMSAAMRASIGQHLATTTVLDHATAWRVAGDILVMCPQLLESPGMRGHLTEDEKNEQSSLANWDAMLYGHSFMVDGVRVDPRRVVVGMSAAAPQVVADERELPPLPEMASAADLAYVMQTPEDWDADYRSTWQELQVESYNKRQWRRYALELRALASAPVQPVAVPHGWKIVPAEPSDAMQAAGAQAIRIDTTAINKIWTGNAVFRAMIAAAPAAPAAQGDVKDEKAELVRSGLTLMVNLKTVKDELEALKGDAKDAERLEFIENGTVDLRCHSAPTGGDDFDIYWNVIEHHMAEPNEREIGWGNTARQAIDAAIATKAAS